MATSGSFSTNAVGSFYITFEWSRTSYDVTANTNTIYYKFSAHNTPGSYRTVYNMDGYVNGAKVIDTTSGVPYYDGETITEGYTTIYNNASGDGSFSASFNGGVGVSSSWNCSGSGSWNLDRIPRYANFTEHRIDSTGLNSLTVRWSADSPCDWLQYSLNGGGWQGISGSPTYTITGLSPNTQYSIRTRIRRTDSQLWTESGYIYGTTKDIARISSVSDFNHGDNINVSTTNPASISSLNLTMTVEGTQIFSKGVSTGSNVMSLSDGELDKLYKEYGSSNSKTATFVLSGSGYTNSATCTVTLTGNQKTIKTKISDEWKRGKVYVKVSDEWKKAVIWTNVDGTWKRSI